MDITLNKEQKQQLLNERWLQIKVDNLLDLYIEVNSNLSFSYGEISTKTDDYREAFCFDKENLRKLHPKRPCDPSYYRDEPLCPCCGAYMLYKFEHCPKCGQKLDWSERTSPC